MDGDAFDLNSQAPETDGFPGLQLYGNILSDSDGLFDGRACMALHNVIRESRIADREFEACDADENYNPMPSSAASTWPEDEPLVEDVNMNAFRDDLAHALFHGV